MKTKGLHRPFRLAKRASCALAIVVVWGFCLRPSQAGYTITIQQVGPDVIANGTGAIDVTGLTGAFHSLNNGAGMIPNSGNINMGSGTIGDVRQYTGGFTGPTQFGDQGPEHANSSSGDILGISESAPGLGMALWVPFGYVNDTPLLDSSTYNNVTISDLGLTPGIYQWTWGAGPDQNFNLDIEAVPEPATWAAGALVTVGLFSRFIPRKRTS